MPQLSASTQIYTDLHDVAEGNYPFKLAVTNGSIDPDDVGDAFEIDYEINYEKYVNGDVKLDPEEPTDPEVSVDNTGLVKQLTDIDAANLTESDYTEASWKTLQGAIKVADFLLLMIINFQI